MELADQQNIENEQQPLKDAVVETDDNTPAEQPKSIREALNAAVKEHSEPKARDDKGKFAPKEAAPEKVEAAKEIPEARSQQPAPQTDGTPGDWSEASKAFLATLPPDHPLKADAARREANFEKGIAKYREVADRHKEIEQVIAPRRAEFQRHGIQTDAQAVQTLLAWESAIRANPQHAIRQLAQSYGVDLSTFAQPPQAQGENELPAQLRPVVDQFGNVVQKVDAVAQRLDQYEAQRMQADIQAFAKDKPHFERVRTLMGQIMAGGGATSLDDAYQKAIYADPDTRALIQQEEQQKAEAERKAAAAAKAKAAADAAVSVRGSSPQGNVQSKAKSTATSVRDSLKEAMKEVRA
jgi:hypothetical protein